MRVSFQEELDGLQANLLEEGELVLRALRGSLNALHDREEQLADEVIAFDDHVDARYFEIEEAIESLLARQTPVAVDLRLVLAMLHINLHLERMADYCVTIAKLTKLSIELEHDQQLVAGFDEMGSRAEEMIRVALSAFANRDVAAAETLVDLDELIDRANRRVVKHLLDREVAPVDLVVEGDHLVGELDVRFPHGVDRRSERPQDEIALLEQVGVDRVEVFLKADPHPNLPVT